MRIKICAIGISKDNSINEQIAQYLKRFSWKVEVIELKPQADSLKEGELLLRQSEGFYRILLDERGKQYTSERFSKALTQHMNLSRSNIAFLIGGAAGHADMIKKQVDESISLSPMTFPHLIARMLLVEQLYRAETLLKGHPYHK